MSEYVRDLSGWRRSVRIGAVFAFLLVLPWMLSTVFGIHGLLGLAWPTTPLMMPAGAVLLVLPDGIPEKVQWLFGLVAAWIFYSFFFGALVHGLRGLAADVRASRAVIKH
jgi:hypothetical protein